MAIDKKRRERERNPDPRRPSGPGYSPWPWHPTLNPGGTWSPVEGPHTPKPTPKPFAPWPPTTPAPTHDWDGKPVRLASNRSKRDLSIGRRRRGGNSGVSKGSSSK